MGQRPSELPAPGAALSVDRPNSAEFTYRTPGSHKLVRVCALTCFGFVLWLVVSWVLSDPAENLATDWTAFDNAGDVGFLVLTDLHRQSDVVDAKEDDRRIRQQGGLLLAGEIQRIVVADDDKVIVGQAGEF